MLKALRNSRSGRDLPLSVHLRMEIAKRKDSVQRDWSYVVRLACVLFHPYSIPPTLILLVQKIDEWGQGMTISFILLRSPLLTTPDPENVIVSREH